MSMLTAQEAARQYAKRPADERFPSLEALVAHAQADKDRSIEKHYNVKDLHAVPTADAILLASPKGEASLTHWAFGQLCRTLGAPAGHYRDALTPDLASKCLNHLITQTPAGTDVQVLARMPNGNPMPVIRACTSESYGRVWDAQLYSALQTNLSHDAKWITPPTWTGEPAGVYRGDRDSFVILVNGGSIVTDPSLSNRPTPPTAPGGVSGPTDGMFRGIMLRNSEVGASSVTIETILMRFICGNHMLWGATMDKQYRRRHFGSNVLRDTIREIGRIAFNWTNASAARDEAIIKGLIAHEVAHTREAVIDELRKLGATKEQAGDAYDRCEQTEPASPRSFWGLSQGLTRVSQDTPYQDERYSLDRIAGQLLAKGRKLVAA